MSATGKSPTPDLAHCPCGGNTLDKLLQPAILAILAEGPMHGYRLAERLGALPMFDGRRPDVSGIYRFLRRMERNGYVVSSWDMSERGPAKKSYELTARGRWCLGHWAETLEAYRRDVQVLLKMTRRACGAGRPAPKCSCTGSK